MTPWQSISTFAVTLFFMLIGLFGLVVPVFPGLLVIWLAGLGYGAMAGFRTWGIVLFVLITLLMIAGMFIDNILMGIGARKGGASWISPVLGMVAGLLGTLIFPPFGGLIASPLVVFIVELIRLKNPRQALKAMGGYTAGWGLSFFARFGIGVMMILVWGIWAFFQL